MAATANRQHVVDGPIASLAMYVHVYCGHLVTCQTSDCFI